MLPSLLIYAIYISLSASFQISDEEMIDHFNVHKQAFNALAQAFLDDPDGGRPEWYQRPHVAALMIATDIKHVDPSGGNYWFDAPYSCEAAKKIKQMDDQSTFVENYSRREIRFFPANRRHEAWNLFVGYNFKEYVYMPISPRIEQGMIKPPQDWGDPGISPLGSQAVDSTDALYWWEWTRGGCVLRRIDPKWFIQRCRHH